MRDTILGFKCIEQLPTYKNVECYKVQNKFGQVFFMSVGLRDAANYGITVESDTLRGLRAKITRQQNGYY